MNKLKIKLLHSWLEALCIAYMKAINSFQPEDPHEELLLEHAREIMATLSTRALADQAHYNITLTGTQAMAFLQFWMLIPLERGSLAQVTVSKIIAAIDRKSKQPKRIQYAF